MSEARDLAVIEDLEFLDETGVGASEAAKRTDFPSAHAMEKWLTRHGRADLWQSLKHRDPAGMHPSGSDRKKARLMSVETATVDPIAALLAEASKSARVRTRKKGEKAAALIEELRTTLANEHEEDERRERARKEIERLERQLAEAKAVLRGTTTLDVSGDVSAAELRSWAKAQGIACPPKGRIPATVREAYDAATTEAAS